MSGTPFETGPKDFTGYLKTICRKSYDGDPDFEKLRPKDSMKLQKSIGSLPSKGDKIGLM